VWPFKRKIEAPDDSGSRPAPAPVFRRDWTGLPPIQRLIGEHPLTAPSDRFSDDLATHHDPSVSREPMGHQVNAEAPSGIVLALARPTTRSDGPAMISRPRVQRRVQSAIEESGEWDGDEAASPAMRPSPLPTDTAPSVMRELPAVAPAAVMQRLTSLPADAEPMPVESAPRRPRFEHSPELAAISPAADPSDAPIAAPPRLTLGQARRLGLGAPISRVPRPAVQRAMAEPAEMPLAPSPVTQPFVANEDVQPPRADHPAATHDETATATHLDLPLAPRESVRIAQPDAPPQVAREISGDSPVQRTTDVAGEPPGDRARQTFTDDTATPGWTEAGVNPIARLPLVQRSMRAPTLPSPASGGGELLAAPASRGGELPGAPASGSGELLAAPATRGGELWTSIAGTPTLPSPASGGGELWTSIVGAPTLPSPASGGGKLRPLVGARPLRATTLQRAPESASVATAPQPLDAQPSARGDDLVVPSSNGSPDAKPSGSLFGSAFSHVERQPHDGPTMPGQAWPVGRLIQVQTRSERSVNRAAELPLAPLQRAAPAESPEQAPGAEWTSEALPRGLFDSPEIAAVTSRAPSPAEAGSSVSTAGPAIASMIGGQKAAETDMDELAGKLYDKIRTRLKSELLVDRERAGFLTDLR